MGLLFSNFDPVHVGFRGLLGVVAVSHDADHGFFGWLFAKGGSEVVHDVHLLFVPLLEIFFTTALHDDACAFGVGAGQDTIRQVGAYLGLVPKQSESGDSKPQLRITKAGDPFLRHTVTVQVERGKDSYDLDLKSEDAS